MARALKEKSISGATTATAGSRLETGGRISVSLFVVANSGDTANDTVDVQLEVSNDGTNWTTARDEDGNKIGILGAADLEDPDGNSNPAAFLKIHGIAAEYIRARATSVTDAAGGDLTVDAWVAATSNTSGTPKNYRETGGA